MGEKQVRLLPVNRARSHAVLHIEIEGKHLGWVPRDQLQGHIQLLSLINAVPAGEL